MRLLDRLIIKEVIGPWLFGVGLFVSLLFATTFLGRLTGYLVDGVPLITVIKIFFLLLPAMLVKTFPMAVLLAGLLAFGRLSSDSEIVALRAAGANVYRIIRPVMIFALFIAVMSFSVDQIVVPKAGETITRLTDEVVKSRAVKSSDPVSKYQVIDGKVRLYISAKKINVAEHKMSGVTIVFLDEKEVEQFVLTCRDLEFYDVNDWRILGESQLTSLNTPPNTAPLVVRLENGAWPDGLPTVHMTIADMLSNRKDEFDLISMATLGAKIKDVKERRSETPAVISNMEYIYWNKLAVPLAAFLFGSLGAVLGIRNHRSGTASGLAMAIGIILAYMLLTQFMSVLANGGLFPAYVASFAPTVVGLFATAIIMVQRNR